MPEAKKPKSTKAAADKKVAAELTAKQRLFVAEYLKDFNGYQAAVRAGYGQKGAAAQAARLLINVNVQNAISDALKRREERTEITSDMVLKRWWQIATADPNELMQLRRGACRYCHGFGHQYQWTEREFEEAKLMAELNEVPPPLMLGGFGFDKTKAAHPKCPECNGEGQQEVFIHDTRKLSSAGKLLFAGVKQTKFGIEVLTQSQEAALLNVAKHLGMFTEKIDLKSKSQVNINHNITPEQAKRIAEEFLKLNESN